ncbi:MAG TPA: hypothetical protein VF754_05805, partial [Pyrinomonadaceae bacterium]
MKRANTIKFWAATVAALLVALGFAACDRGGAPAANKAGNAAAATTPGASANTNDIAQLDAEI